MCLTLGKVFRPKEKNIGFKGELLHIAGNPF
jgi:hypothetical protein